MRYRAFRFPPPSLESVRGASDVVADVGAGVGVVVVAGVEVAGVVVVVAAAAAAAGARLARLAWEAGEGLALLWVGGGGGSS